MSIQFYCIYQIASKLSGKAYIGKTKNLIERLKHHKKPSSKNSELAKEIKNTSWDTFSVTVLAENLTEQEANYLEPYFIKARNTLHPLGFNLDTGGLSPKYCEKVKNKVRDSQKGNKKCLGRVLSAETRCKMSSAKMGRSNRTKA